MAGGTVAIAAANASPATAGTPNQTKEERKAAAKAKKEAAKATVDICFVPPRDPSKWKILSVPATKVDNYLDDDTFVRGDCCVDRECNGSTFGPFCTSGWCSECRTDDDCGADGCFPDFGSGRSFCDCFIAGTRIAMADGTSRAVEDVAVGDQVLGMHGQANTVRSIKTPLLGNRNLHAFNGGGAFVTASHPFLTEAGWKSLDPIATARIVPGLEVGLLQVGDRVRALAGVLATAGSPLSGGPHLEIGLESTMIERIDATSADPTTPIYSLVLDGDHTYFANEMVVHNKD